MCWHAVMCGAMWLHGMARDGIDGVAWCGTDGVAWCGIDGVAWCGIDGVARDGTDGVAWDGLGSHGVVWCGKVWHISWGTWKVRRCMGLPRCMGQCTAGSGLLGPCVVHAWRGRLADHGPGAGEQKPWQRKHGTSLYRKTMTFLDHGGAQRSIVGQSECAFHNIEREKRLRNRVEEVPSRGGTLWEQFVGDGMVHRALQPALKKVASRCEAMSPSSAASPRQQPLQGQTCPQAWQGGVQWICTFRVRYTTMLIRGTARRWLAAAGPITVPSTCQ